MMLDDGEWERDFPMHEQFEDFSGKLRAFTVSCHDVGLGYTVIAMEDGTDCDGFLFRSYSETSPYSALGNLRDKIRRSLATRHLSSSQGGRDMLHDTLRGRISSGDDHGAVLVVDGKPLDMDDLARILQSWEGWEFELCIKSALD